MKNIRKKLQGFVKREKRETGFLGRADGTVRVAGKAHWVYVRLWNGELIEAFNNGNVPAAFGLAVEVEYRGGRYYLTPHDAYDQPVFVGLPDGAEEELQWPGLHTLYVRPEQFLPGLVIPKSGLTVIVCGGSLPLETGGYIVIPTQEIDLTPYRPASNAIWVTIGWSTSGTILIATGGAAYSIGELSVSNVPSTSGYDLAAVKMYNGQTAISHGKYGSMIVDLRWFKLGGGGGTPGGNDTEIQVNAGGSFAGYSTFRRLPNGSVVIGDISPDIQPTDYSFMQAATGLSVGQFLESFGDNVASFITLFTARGTKDAPQRLELGDVIGRIRARGRHAAGYSQTTASLEFIAMDVWTDSDNTKTSIVMRATTDSEINRIVARFPGFMLGKHTLNGITRIASDEYIAIVEYVEVGSNDQIILEGCLYIL